MVLGQESLAMQRWYLTTWCLYFWHAVYALWGLRRRGRPPMRRRPFVRAVDEWLHVGGHGLARWEWPMEAKLGECDVGVLEMWRWVVGGSLSSFVCRYPSLQETYIHGTSSRLRWSSSAALPWPGHRQRPPWPSSSAPSSRPPRGTAPTCPAPPWPGCSASHSPA